MSNIIPFQFEKHSVRVVTDDDGTPQFVAKDLADGLGYAWNGTARIAHVPEEWRGVTSVVTPSGVQEMATLSEAGVFFFLGRSDKPAALPMQKWVAGEVLPSIRKTGVYAISGGEFKLPALESAVVQMVNKALPDLVHAFLAQKQTSIRNGVTAGQVWARHGLPELKNGPQMLSRLLVKEKCAIDGGGRAEIGGKTANLFDPDKADAMMKYSLLSRCQRYIHERESQTTLNFEHARKTEAKIKEIVAGLDVR